MKLCTLVGYVIKIIWRGNSLIPRPKMSGEALVSVPDPKPTPVQIAFSIMHIFPCVILEAIYLQDEVWGQD